MSNVITNANDIELVMEQGGDKLGSPRSMGRIVVDEFTITREEDDTLESGVGYRLPAGVSYGDITFSFDFTMLGSDVDVFNMIANEDGESTPFSFTARKTNDDGDVEFEFALDTCVATSDEYSGSSGDPTEYPVSGVAVSMDRQT